MSNFKHLSIAWRRFCRRWYRKNSYSETSSTKSMAKLPDLSPRLRLIFIIVAFIFLAIAAFILILVILTTNGNELEPNDNHGGSSSTLAKLLFRLKQIINNNRTIVIFLSTTFALFQLMAIGAAIFNWSIVLFSYVIITGIFGTIIGIVGIVGIIFTCLLMRHDNHHDHTITITIAIVISFVFIFYLMTILGLRLMDYFRRRKRNLNDNKMGKSIRNLRLNRNNNGGGGCGQGHDNSHYNNQQQQQNNRRPSSLYRSINSLSINDQQQLRNQIENGIIDINIDDNPNHDS